MSWISHDFWLVGAGAWILLISIGLALLNGVVARIPTWRVGLRLFAFVGFGFQLFRSMPDGRVHLSALLAVWFAFMISGFGSRERLALIPRKK